MLTYGSRHKKRLSVTLNSLLKIAVIFFETAVSVEVKLNRNTSRTNINYM